MKDIRNIIGILLGNTIYALGVTMFILPNNLITGGTTGMALLVNATTGFSITVFVSIFKCQYVFNWVESIREKVCFNDFDQFFLLSIHFRDSSRCF